PNRPSSSSARRRAYEPSSSAATADSNRAVGFELLDDDVGAVVGRDDDIVGRGEHDGEGGAGPFMRVDLDDAAGALDQPLADGKSETRSLVLGRVERDEKVLQDFLRNARPAVGDA